MKKLNKYRYFIHMLNAWVFGTFTVLVCLQPSTYHGLMCGMFGMLVIWNICAYRGEEAP